MHPCMTELELVRPMDNRLLVLQAVQQYRSQLVVVLCQSS